MKRYRVEGEGSLPIPAGEVLGLSRVQYQARGGILEDAGPATVALLQRRAGCFVCRALAGAEFAAGEELDLATAPPRSIADRLLPVGHEDGLRRRPLVASPLAAAARGATPAKAATRPRRGR